MDGTRSFSLVIAIVTKYYLHLHYLKRENQLVTSYFSGRLFTLEMMQTGYKLQLLRFFYNVNILQVNSVNVL